MRLLRAVVAALLLVAATGTVIVAQKGGKPAPPQAKFTLGDGLNVATSELSQQLRAFEIADNSAVTQKWAQQRTDYVYALALADVDGDTFTELVVPGGCADASGISHVFLTAYKQNVAGEVYSGRCDPAQWAQAGFRSPELVGHDFDGDGRDEVVVRTESDVLVFRLGLDDKWTVAAQTVVRNVVIQMGGAGDAPKYEGRSLAVGDADGDGAAEVVVALDYWQPRPDGHSDCKSYVVMFSSGLQVEAWKALTDPDPGLENFCVHYNDGLNLADADGDGKKEIWCAGWTNNVGATQQFLRAMSFRVTTGTNGDTVLERAANWEFGWNTVLGPKLANGSLGANGRDLIVLTRVNSDSSQVGIYSATDNGELAGPPLVYHATDDVQRVHVFGNRVVLGGLMVGAKRLKKGLFLEICEWNETTLRQTGFYGVRDGSEMWTHTVGFGKK